MAITYIGSTLSVAWDLPSGFDDTDVADFQDLDFEYVGKVVSIGELGDTAEDVSFDLLEGGRKTHVNGIRDVGDVPVTVEYDIFDGGIVIVEENANSQVQHAWRVVDTDGQVVYFSGTSANFTEQERSASSYKGAQFQIRVQSGLVRS